MFNRIFSVTSCHAICSPFEPIKALFDFSDSISLPGLPRGIDRNLAIAYEMHVTEISPLPTVSDALTAAAQTSELRVSLWMKPSAKLS